MCLFDKKLTKEQKQFLTITVNNTKQLQKICAQSHHEFMKFIKGFLCSICGNWKSKL